MGKVSRLGRATVRVLVLACCGFGFVATFVPPGWPEVRLAYVAVGLALLVGWGWVVGRKRRAVREP